MGRFTQNTNSATWLRARTRRSRDMAYVVEYGLLAMMLITVVSCGAAYMGTQLNGVYLTVATAMDQFDRPQNILLFGQRTNRNGAPVEREISGKLFAIEAAPLFDEPAVVVSKGP